GSGDALLLQIDLVRSNGSILRGHRSISINLDPLAFVDGGRVKGQRIRNAAAEPAAAFHAEFAGVQACDVHRERSSDFGVIHSVADAILGVDRQRSAADRSDQAFNFAARLVLQTFHFFGEKAAIRSGEAFHGHNLVEESSYGGNAIFEFSGAVSSEGESGTRADLQVKAAAIHGCDCALNIFNLAIIVLLAG